MIRIIPLACLLFVVVPNALAGQSSSSRSEEGWTPQADHAEAVRRAVRDLAVLGALLEPRPDDAWYRTQRLRTLYFLAVDDRDRLDDIDREADLIAALPGAGDSLRALAGAYRGATEVLRAKHGLWPGTRNRHLREGLRVLDGLVEGHPTHPEIRYLRLVSTAYLPFFLGRRETAAADAVALAALLLDNPPALPPVTLVAMTDVLLDGGRLDSSTRHRIRLFREIAMEEDPVDPVAALSVPPTRTRDRLAALQPGVVTSTSGGAGGAR